MKLIKLFEEFEVEAGNSNFQNGQTYKYQFIDAMGKAVTQKTVIIKPSTRDQTQNYELLASGLIKVMGTHGDYNDIAADFLPPAGQPESAINSKGLDLQSTTGQPGVFHHPDFNDINNKTIYQVRIFPNMNEAVTMPTAPVTPAVAPSATPARDEVVEDCLGNIYAEMYRVFDTILAEAKKAKLTNATVTPTEGEWESARKKFFDNQMKGAF
jgi:hypothetical protein